MIPYGHQQLDGADVKAVLKVLKSDWLTTGPKISEFEKALSKYCGAGYAVVFSSGTAALHAAYFAAGLKKGDEFITSPLTFAATANAGLYLRAKPVFADIEWETGNISPKEVERKITRRTKAIVAVDYGGFPAKLSELGKIAKRHKLFLIEDAAHALGASYRGRKIGGISDLTAFSFHPVKSITTGEGGAVLTNRRDFYEKMLAFRHHGIASDARMRFLGFNYRLSDIHSALGISQLKKLGSFIKKRREIAKRYREAFKDIPDLILPRETPGAKSSWHLYPVRLSGKLAGRRQEIFEKLRASGIGVQVHYLPVYQHPYYQKLGYKKGLCPDAEKFSESEISLPIFPSLTFKEQAFVVKILINHVARMA